MRTNIIIFGLAPGVMPTEEFRQRLDDAGVKILAIGERSFRAVTHYGIEKDDIAHALHEVKQLLGG